VSVGAKPAMVLLHGWGMSSAVWAGLPAALSQVLRDHGPAAAIDLPGHGGRPFPPGAADLGGWAQACVALAPPRAVWLGWSLGGLAALAAALHAPERVAGLILMTATPRFVRAPDWLAAMAGETLEQFHAGLLADPAGTLDRFLALQVRGSPAARETLRTLRRELAARPAPDPRALALGLDLLRDGDLRHRLAELSCPSLWLFGSHDTLVPATVAPAVSVLLPQAQVEVIRGAAHAPFLSHPQETAALMDGFLSGLDQGSARGPLAADRRR
jgi:pimeloyl-[acyl-carrier protein] methyl ester esterase